VYGMPALAAAIDRGATAHVREADGPSILRLRLGPGVPICVEAGAPGDPAGRALAALMTSVRRCHDLRAVEVDAQTNLPAGAGLGCSAALGVAIARGVCGLCGGIGDAEALAHAAAWERVFHGTPSGVDAAAAGLGGTLLFRRNGRHGVVRPVTTTTPLLLAIGHSGCSSSTKAMVDSVARLRDKQPERVRRTFNAIHAVVRGAQRAIEKGDLCTLGRLLDSNQDLLADLRLSTPEIESMCHSARAAGALGAKLTGAGGGGCVIALAETRKVGQAVLDAWKGAEKAGFIAELQSRCAAAREARPTTPRRSRA